MIRIKNLHKKFGNIEVLKDINIDFSDSAITMIVGPNGSGKTTLIKSILGLVIPDKGEYYLNEEKINNKWEYKRNISYLPQIAQFPENLTVQELIQFVKSIRDHYSDEKLLIEKFDLKKHLNKKIKTLSGGTLQKLGIILAFMYDCPILILDEPTNGLDPLSFYHFKEILLDEKRKGKCIIITTHIVSFVEEIADEILFMLEGTIYFKGKLEALKELTNEKHLDKAIAKIVEHQYA